MGYIINISCPGCKHMQQLKIGGGFSSNDKDAISKRLIGDALNQWNELLDTLTDYDMTSVIGYCSHCNTYTEKAVVHCESISGTHTIENMCPTCKSTLKTVSEDEVTCPSCHQPISTTLCGFWD